MAKKKKNIAGPIAQSAPITHRRSGLVVAREHGFMQPRSMDPHGPFEGTPYASRFSSSSVSEVEASDSALSTAGGREAGEPLTSASSSSEDSSTACLALTPRLRPRVRTGDRFGAGEAPRRGRRDDASEREGILSRKKCGLIRTCGRAGRRVFLFERPN